MVYSHFPPPMFIKSSLLGRNYKTVSKKTSKMVVKGAKNERIRKKSDSDDAVETEKPSVLQSIGSQRVEHDLATEQQPPHRGRTK